MLQVHAHFYIQLGGTLEFLFFHAVHGQGLGDHVLSEELHRDTLRQLAALKDHATRLAMPVSVDLIGQSIKKLSAGVPPYDAVRLWANELSRVVKSELKQRVFLCLSPKEAGYYASAIGEGEPCFGQKVLDNFPGAEYDVNEAALCLALERSTACVLHLMRVLEIGLSALATHFGVDANHRNWENIIAEIEKEIRSISSNATKPPDWKKEEQHYSDVAKEFRYLKNAWRNHVVHVRNKYTPTEAETVFAHVREFIQHLAQGGLKE